MSLSVYHMAGKGMGDISGTVSWGALQTCPPFFHRTLWSWVGLESVTQEWPFNVGLRMRAVTTGLHLLDGVDE